VRTVIFHPRAQKTIKGFPESVRHRLGRLLYGLQAGELLVFPTSRPMSSISLGAHEIRIKTLEGAFRVFYLLKENRVIVFHAFNKKTQKTPLLQIEVAKIRLKELLA